MKNICIFFFLIFVSGTPVLADGHDGSAVTKDDKAASTEGDFVRGITLWKNNCARCHRMRDPKDFSDYEWDVIATHMRVRTALPGQDMRDILKFLKQSN